MRNSMRSCLVVCTLAVRRVTRIPLSEALTRVRNMIGSAILGFAWAKFLQLRRAAQHSSPPSIFFALVHHQAVSPHFSLYITLINDLKRCITSRKYSITSECQRANVHQARCLQLLCSHPWSNVIIGLGYKYPNPHCSHVLSVDVVDRSVDPATGVVRTERILGCKQKTPAWILKVSTFGSL